MTGGNTIAMLAAWLLALLAFESPASGQDRPAAGVASRPIDVQPRPLDWIPPGTVDRREGPQGLERPGPARHSPDRRRRR